MMRGRLKTTILLMLLLTQLCACAQKTERQDAKTNEMENTGQEQKLEVATFGAGCFWCVEAQFEQLEGVEKVESGYAGGFIENPSYEQVCSGSTGHAEVVNIHYNPEKISYDEMLAAFWQTHDPTQLNRQGNDVGTQYRSVIFYHSNEQKEKAEEYKRRLNEEKAYNAPVVTEISPATKFYKAEEKHQNFYAENPSQPYCMFVVQPKLEKFKKVFKHKLKEGK